MARRVSEGQIRQGLTRLSSRRPPADSLPSLKPFFKRLRLQRAAQPSYARCTPRSRRARTPRPRQAGASDDCGAEGRKAGRASRGGPVGASGTGVPGRPRAEEDGAGRAVPGDGGGGPAWPCRWLASCRGRGGHGAGPATTFPSDASPAEPWARPAPPEVAPPSPALQLPAGLGGWPRSPDYRASFGLWCPPPPPQRGQLHGSHVPSWGHWSHAAPDCGTLASRVSQVCARPSRWSHLGVTSTQ